MFIFTQVASSFTPPYGTPLRGSIILPSPFFTGNRWVYRVPHFGTIQTQFAASVLKSSPTTFYRVIHHHSCTDGVSLWRDMCFNPETDWRRRRDSQSSCRACLRGTRFRFPCVHFYLRNLDLPVGVGPICALRSSITCNVSGI